MVLCYALRLKDFLTYALFLHSFFVTLQDFSVSLCIKAVWGIDEKMGYELETVLDSTFCYKLLQCARLCRFACRRTPDEEPPAVS